MDETRIEKAFCARMDHGGCGVLVEIEQGRIKNIKGDPDCPINYGRLCPKGKAAIERIYHPERLTSPLKRVGARGAGEWNQITWDEALDTIAEKIKTYKDEFGAQSILLAEGAPRGLEYLFTYRFAGALGTPNVVTTGAVCFAPRWGASMLTCGFYPKPDIENSRCIMAWGNNALATSADTTMGFQVRRAIEKGTDTIVIDPKKTNLADKADLWLRIKPGTDGALALGMMNIIVNEELYDEPFVSRWVKGFNELKSYVAEYNPERVSEITWIPVDQIKKAAHLYATTKPAAILWGNGVEHNINSVQINRALVTLMAITGNLDLPGGNIDCPAPTLRHPREFILADKQKQIRSNMIGTQYPLAKMLGFVPSSAAIRAMLEDEPYPVKMMLVHTSNPMVSYANSKKVYDALNRLDFLVVSDLFLTPTAALADIVLPVATNYEFNDLGHYGLPLGGVYARPKLIEPVGQCWSDMKILNELAKRVGLGEYFWEDIDEALDYILEPAGLDFPSFKDIMVLDSPQDGEKGERVGFHTRSGKIEVYSDSMEKWGMSPLPEFKEPVVPDSRYPYILTSIKDAAFFHTSLRNIPSLRKLTPDPPTEVHPDLALSLNLREGDEVIIETKMGSIKQYVKFNESIDPRVVYCDYGWWFAEKGSQDQYGWQESNINILTDDGQFVEPLIGTTTQRGMFCNIKKV
ncbi:MAG: molybdopterin-dependent oxidoreductase [Deltaproteobacteria bacterium]|nr:molybdopterin-dependent oxidoreductase [Deltaproteobacteria bacterium]